MQVEFVKRERVKKPQPAIEGGVYLWGGSTPLMLIRFDSRSFMFVNVSNGHNFFRCVHHCGDASFEATIEATIRENNLVYIPDARLVIPREEA